MVKNLNDFNQDTCHQITARPAFRNPYGFAVLLSRLSTSKFCVPGKVSIYNGSDFDFCRVLQYWTLVYSELNILHTSYAEPASGIFHFLKKCTISYVFKDPLQPYNNKALSYIFERIAKYVRVTSLLSSCIAIHVG